MPQLTDETLLEVARAVIEAVDADAGSPEPVVIHLQLFDHRRRLEIYTPGLPVRVIKAPEGFF